MYFQINVFSPDVFTKQPSVFYSGIINVADELPKANLWEMLKRFKTKSVCNI